MRASALFDLTGRVALVTGASSGLGARFARVLAANGARVVLVARRAERLEALAGEIGEGAVAVSADATDRTSMARAFDAAEEHFGTVDLLVNNAGTTRSASALKMSEADWRDVLDVNLDAVFFTAQEAGRRMIAGKVDGAIVNIASVLGFAVTPGIASYAVSKAGVVQLTKALAQEWGGRGVRVNAIAPGWFVTEINEDYLQGETRERMERANPMRRLGEEGDLDGALLLLASKAGAYVNGATIMVDGGHVLGG